MKDHPKKKSHSCPYCVPKDPDNPCLLADAKTVIDGKEYSACCANPTKKNSKLAKTAKKEKGKK